jgi:hypothetical protein
MKDPKYKFQFKAFNKLLLICGFTLLLLNSTARAEVIDFGDYFKSLSQAKSQNTSQSFQEKRSVIISGGGGSYKFNRYKISSLLGEVIGGSSGSSANFSISTGYFSNPQTITHAQLEIISLSPANLSKVYKNQTLKIEVIAQGDYQSSLSYQYIIDGRVQLGSPKQAWKASNIFDWNIPDSAVGKTHLITVRVMDNAGRAVSTTSKIFLIHRPISPPERALPLAY